MVLKRQEGNPVQELHALMTREDLSVIREMVAQTFVSDPVVQYIVDLIVATRQNSDISQGASPRATLALTAMAKAVAQLRGRDYVVPGDVREVYLHTIAHRLILSPRAQAQNRTAEQILREILESTPAPKLR